jgi:hypothetical protein
MTSIITTQTFFQGEPPSGDDALCVRRTRAAQMLSISVSTLDRLVKAGELTCLKLPGCVLFRVDTLRAWARGRESRDGADGVVSEFQTDPNHRPAAQGG